MWRKHVVRLRPRSSGIRKASNSNDICSHLEVFHFFSRVCPINIILRTTLRVLMVLWHSAALTVSSASGKALDDTTSEYRTQGACRPFSHAYFSSAIRTYPSVTSLLVIPSKRPRAIRSSSLNTDHRFADDIARVKVVCARKYPLYDMCSCLYRPFVGTASR